MDDALTPRPAGFWIRAVALAIDAVVCAVVQASFSGLARLLGRSTGEGPESAGSTAFLFTLIFAAAYWTVLHAVAGQTLGKSVVGVRVVGTDGALLTFGPSLLRYLASVLSLATCGFGFLMAALRRDKRALHDLIAGSRVERLAAPRPMVRRVPRPAPAEPAPVPVGSSPSAARIVLARRLRTRSGNVGITPATAWRRGVGARRAEAHRAPATT
ncbi:MAG TPA: RDD family protein, partial [Patescibacteria group bacterium]|nr:RDD family protein [Patescibacteria group bacterium]